MFGYGHVNIDAMAAAAVAVYDGDGGVYGCKLLAHYGVVKLS